MLQCMIYLLLLYTWESICPSIIIVGCSKNVHFCCIWCWWWWRLWWYNIRFGNEWDYRSLIFLCYQHSMFVGSVLELGLHLIHFLYRFCLLLHTFFFNASIVYIRAHPHFISHLCIRNTNKIKRVNKTVQIHRRYAT